MAEDLDAVCHALSDPTRRRIVELLRAAPGTTTAELAGSIRRVSRWAVMKHLAVLRDAGLLETLAQGRRRRHYLDRRQLEPLQAWLVTVASAPPAGPDQPPM